MDNDKRQGMKWTLDKLVKYGLQQESILHSSTLASAANINETNYASLKMLAFCLAGF